MCSLMGYGYNVFYFIHVATFFAKWEYFDSVILFAPLVGVGAELSIPGCIITSVGRGNW